MVKQSNVDIAYDIVSANGSPITFADLWAKLCEVNNYTEQEATRKIGSFYTSLLLDGRFVILENNTWDLRTRTKFEKISERTAMYNDEEETVDGYDPEEDDREDFFGSSFDDKDDEETEKEENE